MYIPQLPYAVRSPSPHRPRAIGFTRGDLDKDDKYVTGYEQPDDIDRTHEAPLRAPPAGLPLLHFADLTVWDMLFGTFRNPREFRGEFGFDAGADRKMGAMFAFADVNAPLYGPGSRGAKPKGAT